MDTWYDEFMQTVDVIVIGAGAAGMMCAREAGARGRKVLVLEKTQKPGKKILMSGGGRCNFTNRVVQSEHFISHNQHFCTSALRRYTPEHFIALVEKHGIEYYEKIHGQLFCRDKAHVIVNMLLQECASHNVLIMLNQNVSLVEKKANKYYVVSNDITYQCASLVVATGGLSIPTLGSSPWGYNIAEQFGISVYPTRAGLVPFTLHIEDKLHFTPLSGIAMDARVSCRKKSFRENILFTHRGLSGPSILQISSYWHAGDNLNICLLPELDVYACLAEWQRDQPNKQLKTHLEYLMPRAVVNIFYTEMAIDKPIKQYALSDLKKIAERIQAWSIKPNGTEGYRTAEVTIGGVDCDAVSSQTCEAYDVPGLYFIGEVLDVTGWLGGYNFQWAWSSGWAAGQVV